MYSPEAQPSGVTTSETKRLHEFLLSLYAPQSEEELKQTIVRGLLRIIPGDDTILTTSDIEKTAIGSYADKNAQENAAYLTCLKNHLHESPAFHIWGDPGHFWEIVLSDYTSQAKWHRTSLYNEFFRPQSLEDHLAVKLDRPPVDMIGIAVLRDKWGFTSHERSLINLLLPHFEQAFKNARHAASSLPIAFLSQIKSDASDNMVLLDDGKRIIYCPESSRRILGLFFGPSGGLDRMPVELEGWIEHSSHVPYKKIKENETLEVRFYRDPDTRKCLLVARATGPSSSMLHLSKLGLSCRETEVLYWIAQGKRNEEIAVILNVSFFTVKAHLRNIFRRLGVETRTAAAAVATRYL